MLVLLLLAAAGTVIGVGGLVHRVQGTARHLHVETVRASALHSAIAEHELVGHRLLFAQPVDRAAFILQQHDVSVLFDQTAAAFPEKNGLRATVVKAKQVWQEGLTTFSLWGDQVNSLHGDVGAANQAFGGASDDVYTLLDTLEGPSLDAMDEGMARAGNLERNLIVALVCMFGFAVAVTAYFRRRMVRDLLRPVTNMHEGVLKLQAGEYEHRIEVARRDELGELTDAFNEMAGALHDSHEALTFRATHDSLTGLLNRASLTERLTASFGPGTDRRAMKESVLFIDVDDFKEVNDSLGHESGDALLIQLAARLGDCLRPQDTLARLGGDEFAILLIEDEGGLVAGLVADRIIDALHTPFVVNDVSIVVSVSIGGAHRRPDTADAAELLRSADFAMYMAKGSGKDRYQLFDAQEHDIIVGRSVLRGDLAFAAPSGQLRLQYQPIADLRTGDIIGVEALVRWQHPLRGLVSPADFISLAEETGDICAIGSWVLETAARQASIWRESIPGYADLWVSVNFSPAQLNDPSSVAALQRILAEPDIDAGHVVLEFTETALAADADEAVAALNTLKQLGVRLAIDDFGTGFSSLSTLTTLPVDILKIDRSFVSGQASSTPSVPMLEGILGLAGKLSLPVIAEGIEEIEQLDLLRAFGCQMGQGYLLARPVDATGLERLLVEGSIVCVTEAQPLPA
ncbi:MAG: hypothetical protein QOG69_2906 [Actinomycetota bacterium]|jgi:diguanylate cyclase (GGDEF)-like protein|nr:hypothetical protein [Actinomycetota bacterium]